ncbi:N-acetylmuramoyl-L-alanine amidase [Bacillus sp. J14TS2]|uniref:N-acetylmuramoyl-L-alanine amidase n=1 Tax=Bacillus sp. J14TS2 TaxID=2807188 RepID=UPI001B037C07|nr:N-acetylmuramoyl-L-alanine amidase [Bacillus sp. J14TS2]GIN70323.1 N-acetylmuramoyl-L-alanine amidase [Bacillus sp. J14TS2]
MKYNIMTSIVFFVGLFVLLPNVHADNGKIYKVDSATIELMDAPAPDATVLAKLDQDEKVTIFEESYGWGKTYFDGKEAWVALYQLISVNNTQELSEAEQQDQANIVETTANESPEKGQLYRVKASVLNLRNAPDMDATIITHLNKGYKVSIFEKSSGWGKTYFDGNEAWVALNWLETDNESIDSGVSEENETNDSLQAEEEIENEESEAVHDQKDDENRKLTVESTDNDEKQNTQTKQISGNSLAGYHFVIDPGHGGKDPGAIGSEVYEKTLTLSTAKKLERQLNNKGATVTLTRADDTYISLEKRTEISNSNNTDAFISLHYNSSNDQAVHGIETFYSGDDDNRQLANAVHSSVVNHVNLNDRGAKQADFQVLKENQQQAILIELGFISNPDEQKLIQTDRYQEEAVKGITIGLEEYYNE